MSSLLVIKGPNLGMRYELGDLTRLGRAAENEIVIAEAGVSRLHAEIVRQRMAYTVRDCGSTNGVFVNGQRVDERLLLRNDELRIANTVFLFNSDLVIRNARYSNSTLYMYPAENETVSLARHQSQLERLAGAERESFEFIMRIAELFCGSPASLGETAERLMEHVRQLLTGDCALLFLRAPGQAEMQPVVAVPSGRPVQLNRRLLATVLEDHHALLSSERPTNLPEMEAQDASCDGSQEHESLDGSQGLSIICAPVIQDRAVVGVMVVEKEELDYFSLRDLGLLQAIARLSAATLEAARLGEQLASLQASVASGKAVTSRNAQVQQIFASAARVAQSEATVLITGESGTGKEVLARHIHELSPRREGPFVAINCAAIPASLFESELFGYERGAFTGAVRTTPGKVEQANGGTLFLDEVGELDLALQPKLLRFVQERAFYRVGGTRVMDAQLRIVAATNRDLAEAVREGQFREDLWYRLNVIAFELPPLRCRREDIPVLVDHAVARYATLRNRKVLGANDAAMALLQKYDWPGNIRELENAVERAVLLARGKILSASDFSHVEEARRQMAASAEIQKRRQTLTLAELEREHILAVLKKFDWNQARAAEALGVHRNTLRNKITEYGLAAVH